MGCSANLNISKINIENNILNRKNSFIDQSFPPLNSSIFGEKNLEKIAKGIKIPHQKHFKDLLKDFSNNKIVWKRLKDIFNNKKYKLFSKNISSKNIIQGSIGNCYFLTIISALTKFPSLLYQLFNTRKISTNGSYEIYLKINNKISIIELDDYFPYNLRTNKPVFCKSNNNEIFAMLLEKAFAKIKGCYINLDNGTPVDALDMVLLSSKLKKDVIYNFYSLKNDGDKDIIWKNIFEKNKNENTFMICLSKGKIKNKKKLKNFCYTIAEKHFYNIIDIFEKNEKFLLKLRNPWGFNKKNKNFNINIIENDFIIDINDERIIKMEEEDILEEAEFIIDFNYFCYLFEEIQIYEIKNFLFNTYIEFIDENYKFEIIDINLKKSNLKGDIKIKINLEDININDNDILNIMVLVIDKINMKVINKINNVIDIKKLELIISLGLTYELSSNYYICLFIHSGNGKKILKGKKFHIVFQSEFYIDIIFNHHFYDDERLLDIIKEEINFSKCDINSLIYEKNCVEKEF